ncbi:HCO3 transporter family-domain-containing protein [Hyaloraphidium curvatum]|nr:HCO3 transporter family-domain-containing protein [Hyaloraphidium curvatum]
MGRWTPLRGVRVDVAARLPLWASDWRDGLFHRRPPGSRRVSPSILAPALYIFTASVLPALAFGQQMAVATGGLATPLQTLLSTGIGGVLQSVVGGQPLLIVGVAEPIVVIWVILYGFAEARGIAFLPWCGWVCTFTAAMLAILAVTNACDAVGLFTRFAGESFGLLIAILFAQVGIVGAVHEFRPEGGAGWSPWTLVNGLWALILALGLAITSLGTRHARRWRYLRDLLRGLVADYGVPMLVVAWSALSFAVACTDCGEPVPRRVQAPDAWAPGALAGITSTVPAMASVPGPYIAAALLPAAIVAMLFYFDHSVSAQLAQSPDFGLRKPSAYHYDLLLLAGTTLALGLLGLPPVNGVIPQAPMHTRSLAVVDDAVVEERVELPEHEPPKRDIEKQELGELSAQDQLESNLEEPDTDRPAAAQPATEPPADVPHHPHIRVTETRLANLIQSLLCFAGTAAMPLARLVPSGVIWGYFLFLALESLPTSQLFERLRFCLTDPARRRAAFSRPHAACLRTVPFPTLAWFTALQVFVVLGIWAFAAFAGPAGVAFPVLIVALVPLRRYVLPRWFGARELAELDRAEWEEERGEPAPEEAEEGGEVEGGFAGVEPVRWVDPAADA